MQVENKAKLIGLLSIALLMFTIAAIAVSPPAFAGKGEVRFTDVNGQWVRSWRTGETMFITVTDADENRDSDEVELIQGTFTDELGNVLPLVEVVDPNTGDRETSAGGFVLQETGVDTGEFRNFPGLRIEPLAQGQAATPNNGFLEVKDNDTIYVYYTDPSDLSDIDTDLAKIDFTYAEIKITDRDGNEVPLFKVGQDAFVTVWDDDENRDPIKVERIEGVTLVNQRMVNEGLPGGVETLTLVETGPDTGVFRNVDGVLLQDARGTVPQSDTDLILPVLDKDTIVAFYRAPVIGRVPPPPPTKADCATDPTGVLEFCRQIPRTVAPGASFTVTVTLTNKGTTTLQLPAFSDKLPAGFSPESKTDFATSLEAGKSVTFTYTATASSAPGDYTITGTAKAVGIDAFPVSSAITVGAAAAGAGVGLSTVSVIAQGTVSKTDGIEFTRTVPDQVAPGATFYVTVKITNRTDTTLSLAAYKDTLPKGFTPASVSNFEQDLAPGETVEWTYKATAAMTPGTYTITGKARAIGVGPVRLDSPIEVTAAPPAGPGLGDPNDMSDFMLDVADIAEPNPSTVAFTDENGVEKKEFRITEDVYITVRDDDENTDSDRAEVVHVDVYNVNGGRELGLELVETGLNTGVFRNRDALILVGVDTLPPGQDLPNDGKLAVHNRDTIYVMYADKESPTYDPFDISFDWARIFDCEVFTPEANKIWFTSEAWNPIDKVKKGQELFIKVEECDQNEYSELVDSFVATLYDRDTGDVEKVVMVETGPNTGVFHGQGIKMWRPVGGMVPAMVGDGVLQIEDRDKIVVWYQDPNNLGDFSLAEAELAPRPITPICKSRTRFTDAQERDVAKYVVGDTVYVTVDDCDENRTPGVVDTIKGALVVENPRTGVSVKPDLVETGPDTGIFLSEPITTGPPGSGAMLEVEPGDTLKATYTDPDDPTDVSSDDVAIESPVCKFTDALNQPNPLVTTTMFKAIGVGILETQVRVYDLTGRLVFEKRVPGDSLTWDGAGLGNGVYLYIVQVFGRQGVCGTSAVKKLVILRK